MKIRLVMVKHFLGEKKKIKLHDTKWVGLQLTRSALKNPIDSFSKKKKNGKLSHSQKPPFIEKPLFWNILHAAFNLHGFQWLCQLDSFFFFFVEKLSIGFLSALLVNCSPTQN